MFCVKNYYSRGEINLNQFDTDCIEYTIDLQSENEYLKVGNEKRTKNN